jgi:hypothetical protein
MTSDMRRSGTADNSLRAAVAVRLHVTSHSRGDTFKGLQCLHDFQSVLTRSIGHITWPIEAMF